MKIHRLHWGILLAMPIFLLVPGLASAAVITVNSNTDLRTPSDGFCELAEAIDNANQQTGVDVSGGDCTAGDVGPNDIAFNIPGGIQTIVINSDMGVISSEIHVDGLTQDAGASCAPRNLYISIDGNLSTQKIFYFLPGSENSTVRGLNIFGTTVAAIDINTNSITVTCNNIGTDITGTSGAPNANQDSGI
ncbi:hypothetical protein IT411_03220, partial [Candidatus Peregrinibacteria bacterium]|nr:hypothetical protein [Candidatus Peregrinibacteria bacterium]